MQLSYFENNIENYLQKSTIIYGSCYTEKTNLVNKIIKLFPNDIRTYFLNNNSIDEIDQLIEKRKTIIKEQNNLKYYENILEIIYNTIEYVENDIDCYTPNLLDKINKLDPCRIYNIDDINISYFDNLRKKSLQNLEQFNIFERNDMYNIVIIDDEELNDNTNINKLLNKILICMYDINITLIATRPHSKCLTPAMRSCFKTSIFFDKNNLNNYVFSLSNLCSKEVREMTALLINQDTPPIVLLRNSKEKIRLLVT